MDLLDYIDSAAMDFCYDSEQFDFFDNSNAGKRQTSSDLPEAKRQRLDTCEYSFSESVESNDFVKLFDQYKNSPETTDNECLPFNMEQAPIEENSTGDFQMANAQIKISEPTSTVESEEIADKSSSGSAGKQFHPLKIVGRPLREKPQEPKKIRKPIPPSCEEPQTDVTQKQEILKEPFTTQSKNIILSVKAIEVEKPQDAQIFNQVNVVDPPQPPKYKFVDSQNPVLSSGLHLQNEMICEQFQPMIQMVDEVMLTPNTMSDRVQSQTNVLRPAQGPHSVTNSMKETIVFNPSQVNLWKVQKENVPSPNFIIPCKNLKIVHAPSQKILNLNMGRSQPLVQQPMTNFATKHKVVFKSIHPLQSRKVFSLLPYQPEVNSGGMGRVSAAPACLPVEKPRRIILKSKNDKDIVSAEDFARFMSRHSS